MFKKYNKTSTKKLVDESCKLTPPELSNDAQPNARTALVSKL